MHGLRRLLVAAVLTSAVAVLPTPPATAAPPAPSPGSEVDRVTQDRRILESSGLAPSLRRPGVLWTHNDSGHPAQLFAIGPDGRTVATVRVAGAPAQDWEAIASYRDRSGRPMIVVADIGDGGAKRTSVALVVLPEPTLRVTSVRPERVIRLAYPTGPVDAEAILVDPNGDRAFIVTKGVGSVIFQVPQPVWQASGSSRGTLVRRAGVPLILVTDGAMGPGGHPVLRTYGELAVLPPLRETTLTGSTVEPLATMPLPAQRQGESLALPVAGTVLIGSEGERQPVLRVPLPPGVQGALTGAVRGSASPQGSRQLDGSTSDAASPSDQGGSRSWRDWLLPALGGAVLAVVGAVLVPVWLARRRRRTRTYSSSA